MAHRIELFEVASGRSPVKDYIRDASLEDQGDIINVMELLEELGFDLLGTKFMKKVFNDLFELRVKGRQLHRILFFFSSEAGFIMVHAFAKQAARTPQKEIATAIGRMNTWLGAHDRSRSRRV